MPSARFTRVKVDVTRSKRGSAAEGRLQEFEFEIRKLQAVVHAGLASGQDFGPSTLDSKWPGLPAPVVLLHRNCVKSSSASIVALASLRGRHGTHPAGRRILGKGRQVSV